MAKTVIALMSTAQEAETVVRELTSTCSCDRSDIGFMAHGGGAIGALMNLGVPEEEAHYYAEGVRRGGTLITVHARTDEIADCAVQVTNRHGGADIEQRAKQWKQQGWSGKLSEGDNLSQENNLSEGEQVLPVTEEELVVGKRQVSQGGVRVYSHVTETPVQETVELREEHVQVERRPVNRPAGDGDFQEKTIEMREMSEEPVVSKRSRVTEEVRVGKQATQREQTVSDKIRKTDVRVEKTGDRGAQFGGSNSSSSNSPERRRGNTPYSGGERRMSQ